MTTSSSANKGGLQVIGAGQGRTGTASLKEALEILLNGKCHHMQEVLLVHPETQNIWGRSAHENITDNEFRELFQDYAACVDVPAAIFYKQLMHIYPNAKVILTERDPDSWVRSMRSTVLKIELHFRLNECFLAKLMRKFIIKIPSHVISRTFERLSMDYLNFTDENWRNYFINWNAEVKRSVPSDRLLVYEVKQGWKPLCDFLNLPIPNCPFPNVNSTDEFSERIENLKKINNVMKVITFAVEATLVIGGAYFLHKYLLNKI